MSHKPFGPTLLYPFDSAHLDPYDPHVCCSSPYQLPRCRSIGTPQPVGSSISASASTASISNWPSHDPSRSDHFSLPYRLCPICYHFRLNWLSPIHPPSDPWPHLTMPWSWPSSSGRLCPTWCYPTWLCHLPCLSCLCLPLVRCVPTLVSLSATLLSGKLNWSQIGWISLSR